MTPAAPKPPKATPKERAWGSTMPRPTARMNQESTKHRKSEATHRVVGGQRLADFPVCEVPVCTERSTDRHHVLKRSGGGKNEYTNYRALCRKHHDLIHHDVIWKRWAHASGFLRRSNRKGGQDDGLAGDD